jgi:hypothetical protein
MRLKAAGSFVRYDYAMYGKCDWLNEYESAHCPTYTPDRSELGSFRCAV